MAGNSEVEGSRFARKVEEIERLIRADDKALGGSSPAALLETTQAWLKETRIEEQNSGLDIRCQASLYPTERGFRGDEGRSGEARRLKLGRPSYASVFAGWYHMLASGLSRPFFACSSCSRRARACLVNVKRVGVVAPCLKNPTSLFQTQQLSVNRRAAHTPKFYLIAGGNRYQHGISPPISSSGACLRARGITTAL